MIDGTLFRIDVRIGFRVHPLLTLYLRQIIEDLVEEGKIDMTSGFESLRKRNISGDFRFIVIHRIFYPSSSDDKRDNFMMNLYSFIKHLGITEERALGLDTSNVVVEHVPLIVKQDTYGKRITKQEDVKIEEQVF